MKLTIKELRARYWINNPQAKKALVFTRKTGGEPLEICNPLALALARVNFDNAQAIRNRVAMYAASPAARKRALSEAHAQMQRANENLMAAYLGYDE